jgi:DNA-binding Lrp family transcriptional regulator
MRKMNGAINLDRIDFEILSALREDARLSNKELAARVNLAQSSCLERVRRLREQGVLRGAHTEVDPESLGVHLQAMIAVRLKQHSRELVESFRAHALELSEVLGLYHVAGEDDFLVHVAVRDAHYLRDFAMDAFTTRPEVAHIRTSLIYEHRKRWGLPDFVGEAVKGGTPGPKRP